MTDRCVRRWLRRAALLAAGVLGVFAIMLALLIVPALPDPVPGFAARHGTLTAVEELARRRLDDTDVVELRLRSSSGLTLELAVRVPRAVTAPQPLVVLAAGLRTGHRAAYLLARQPPGIVIATLSYPFPGDPRAHGLRWLTWLPKLRRAVLDTTPAVMLALDYLVQQPYVDARHVELVGGSFGAFLVSVPGALDARVRRVWLVHGAADPAAVFAHLLQPHIGFAPLRDAVAELLALTVASQHLRPDRWVARVAPRPVIVVNARGDESLPPASVAALHAALAPPGEVIWTEGPHVRPGRTAVVEGLVALVAERVRRDPPPRAAADADSRR
jgi:dienelactone hydrolase